MPLVDSSSAPPGATTAATGVSNGRAYWRKTSALMWMMLIVWIVFGFVVHIFAPSLNTIRFLGFPLGFYMAAQGSLIVFVVMLYVFAARQNAIDEEFGVAEE